MKELNNSTMDYVLEASINRHSEGSNRLIAGKEKMLTIYEDCHQQVKDYWGEQR